MSLLAKDLTEGRTDSAVAASTLRELASRLISSGVRDSRQGC